ncbi:hypothetical protein [Paenibacillus sp. B1-33]|uniref:hypothetical protein n=1 Tax=unclassified Paenibacillus TaxID=185978 RepID=UPI003D2AC8A5
MISQPQLAGIQAVMTPTIPIPPLVRGEPQNFPQQNAMLNRTYINLLQDWGFEQQNNSRVSLPWEVEGSATNAGIEFNGNNVNEGTKYAWISGTTGWHAIKQRVHLDPSSRYRLEGWVRCSQNVVDGYFGVRYPNYGGPYMIVKETIFGGSA